MKENLFNKPYMSIFQKDKVLKKNRLENICLISRYSCCPELANVFIASRFD